jgi:hypothetical protein
MVAAQDPNYNMLRDMLYQVLIPKDCPNRDCKILEILEPLNLAIKVDIYADVLVSLSMLCR